MVVNKTGVSPGGNYKPYVSHSSSRLKDQSSGLVNNKIIQTLEMFLFTSVSPFLPKLDKQGLKGKMEEDRTPPF